MAEAAEILRRLWSGQEVTFSGEHYRVEGHRCVPLPRQKPLPLLIGGNGRGVLTTAGRLAHIVGFTGSSQVEDEGSVNRTHFTTDGLAAALLRLTDRDPSRAGWRDAV
jgi:alkanesulfonate monooxygenase SsuD/methylene tetrahydromethanopterin reductase-like flavin-dependent oxidoreductase (luciferase family)